MTEGLADAERHKTRYQEDLELRVEERTAELSRVNADLRERIAAHERAVEALRLSEARLAKAQAIAHLGNWEWDLVTGQWQWSDEVDRILGAPSQHLSANRNDFLSLVHPEDRGRARRAVSESLRSGNAIRLDLRTVTPGGEVRTVHIRAEVAFDETGRPACMTGTVLDITERVRAEAEAKLRQQQLVHADRMASLGILAAGVAHEINNPNHSILSNASVLRKIWTGVTPVLDRYSEENGDFALGGSDYSAWQDRIPGMFGSLVENSNRIKAIVQELRAYARQDATEPLGAIDLNALVRSAHILLKAMVKESTNRFDVQLAADLPLVRGNFQRLEQVVINLIQNACQALPGKDRGLSVTTAYDTRQDLVVMEVQDEGIGILEKDLTKEARLVAEWPLDTARPNMPT